MNASQPEPVAGSPPVPRDQSYPLEGYTHQADPHQRARLRWRARRGLLENDIVLSRFLDAHEATLSDPEVGALTHLLEMSDNDLLELILCRRQLSSDQASAPLDRVLDLLRAA